MRFKKKGGLEREIFGGGGDAGERTKEREEGVSVIEGDLRGSGIFRLREARREVWCVYRFALMLLTS